MTAFPPEHPPSDGSAPEDPDGVAPSDPPTASTPPAASTPSDVSADGTDELTASAVERLRALLQTEDSPVDPARRDAAILAALAAGDAPVGEPRHQTSHTSAPHHGRPRRRRHRLERRVLAAAAAVLLVLAGATAVLADGWSGGSSSSDEDATGTEEVTVDAELGGSELGGSEPAESDGTASQEDSAETRSSPEDPAPATTTAGAATATESAPDLDAARLPHLGEYPDADTLLAAASSMALPGTAPDDGSPTAGCAAAWSSPDAQTLATATVQGVPVTVLRSGDPAATQRLAAVTADCRVLAQR